MSIPFQYLQGLLPSEAFRQKKLIKETQEEYKETGLVKERPKVSDTPTKRSSHVIKFEKKYGYGLGDISRIKKDFPDTDVETILSKGRAAYASGSRPNTGIEQWAKARLASVLTGGPALKIDKDLVGARSLAKIKSS
jgi:hypothetical protein